MHATTADGEKHSVDDRDCEYEWCDGPDGDVLPCFDCYDPSKAYCLEPEP
jgi:hypothetical protein